MRIKNERQQVGKFGEDLALKFMQRKGYKLIDRNYKVDEGEMDLIMEHNNVTVFIEVRTRVINDQTTAEDSIVIQKISRLEEIAENYIYTKKIYHSCRIDAVCILLSQTFKLISINHYEDITNWF